MDWDKLKVGQVWETDSEYDWMKIVRIYNIYPDEIAVECFGEKYTEWFTNEEAPNFTKLLKDAE